MMLSRIAESLFWIGRYVERASDQARVLEVHLDLGAGAGGATGLNFGATLCKAMGAPPDACETYQKVWDTLGLNPDSALSIVSTFANCRESARRCREILSTSTWEAINRAWRTIQFGNLDQMRPPEACRVVRDFSSMIVGTLSDTMPRDQAWYFLAAGRFIERVDMTSRILYATVVAPARPATHHVLLRACGAQQAYVVSRGQEDSLSAAVDFLMRDRLFPRSVVHSLTSAQDSLAALDPTVLRTGFEDDAQRLLGRACATVEYSASQDPMADLGGRTARLLDVCRQATQALTTRYFEGALVPQWNER
ncbi:alpha-E domain-containing protein [Propionibacterium sp.]|uniref:alpha-E domain-containing protein n=1 Tax=Propionibacterium sp. TaxID=1977903 RepID=UPI0039E76E43